MNDDQSFVLFNNLLTTGEHGIVGNKIRVEKGTEITDNKRKFKILLILNDLKSYEGFSW